MIKQIVGRITFTSDELSYISSLKPHNGKQWGLSTEKMKELKKSIKRGLKIIQDEKCTYCGIIYKNDNEREIEHIAPKDQYGNFTFEVENLVLSCHSCNTFGQKSTEDTIQKLNNTYSASIFKLVHPYFDIPEEHYDWIDKMNKVLILPRTPKGKYSITIFKLNHPNMSEKRAGQLMLEKLNTQSVDQLIGAILSYKSF